MKNKQTVLVVDDIEENLNIVAQILIENNINIVLAQNGKDAILSAKKIIPDLILLDIMMPGLSGFEVCKTLKSNKETQNIPIIFLTAVYETEKIVKGFDLGAVDYINKPFINEVLISRVKTHLKIHKQFLELQIKEEKILENQTRLSCVINSIPDLIFYKDTKSRYTGFNKAFSDYIGEKPENIIGYTDFDFYNNKDAVLFQDSDKKIMESGKDFVFKEWTQDFSGNQIFLDTKKTPIINSEGKIIGVVGVSRNISELKITERKLKENQEKLTNIYENANEGIFILQDKKIVFLNNKLSEILEYSKDELQNHNFLKFVHKEDKEKTAEFYQKKIKGVKIGKAIVFRIKTSKNITKYVKINSKQIIWENNYAILGMLDDITEQHILQKELIKSKNRLYLSQKAGKVGAWEWNIKTDKIRCSDMAFEIFGIQKPTKFLSSKEFFQYVYPEDKKDIILEFQNFIEKNINEHKSEYRILKNKSEIHWVEGKYELIYNEKNEIKKMTGVVLDITERKQFEHQLKLKNTEIKQKQVDILASIRYAKTIQTSLLPEKKMMEEILGNNFIIFKPKDIVGGDFYSVNKIENNIYFSVADCTGHGVPGGFITMLGINSLHSILKENKTINSAEILNLLRAQIKDVFKGSKKNNINGIDIAFCRVDIETNILQYSGAFNPLWIIRNDDLIELKATRNPIGFYPIEKDFKNHEIQLKNKDKIYLFSDGFKDQIGGKEIKKYNNTKFKEFIFKTSKFPILEQKNIILKELEEWKGINEQIDDITIMGIEWRI